MFHTWLLLMQSHLKESTYFPGFTLGTLTMSTIPNQHIIVCSSCIYIPGIIFAIPSLPASLLASKTSPNRISQLFSTLQPCPG